MLSKNIFYGIGGKLMFISNKIEEKIIDLTKKLLDPVEEQNFKQEIVKKNLVDKYSFHRFLTEVLPTTQSSIPGELKYPRN